MWFVGDRTITQTKKDLERLPLLGMRVLSRQTHSEASLID